MGRMKETAGGDLFAYQEPPRAHARTSDPSTSHEAARKITPKLTAIQDRVLALFKARRRMTDLDLQATTGFAGSTFRTRRAELVELGLLRNSGQKVEQQGSRRIIWEIIE